MRNASQGSQYKVIEPNQLELKDSAIATFDYDFANDNSLDGIINNDDARIFFSTEQKICLGFALCLSIFFGARSLSSSAYYFIVVVNLLYFLVLSFRIYVILIGKNRQPQQLELINISEHEWPSYTILVPLHDEPEVIRQLIYNLVKIDYPKEKLQILLILEESDLETQAALKKIKLEKYFIPIIVPYSYPQTKPKACNYALKYATGEYLVIYDAEDKPDVLQLKKAVTYFKRKSSDIVCYQAILSYFNLAENWLTQMFSLEYALLFERMLPAFGYLNLPIPLGGTSNHFRFKDLKQLGGWDAYNVTEDADLGIKCAKAKLKVEMLPSTTEEEATITIRAWLKQRSRWIKGFLQTYFVHMRNPMELYRSLGLKGFIAFNILIGICNFLYILIPLMIVVMSLITFDLIPLEPAKLKLVWYLSASCLIFGIISIQWSAYEIVVSSKKLNNIRVWWEFPLYTYLMPLASLIAVYQIFTKLHFWEKTKHGVTAKV